MSTFTVIRKEVVTSGLPRFRFSKTIGVEDLIGLMLAEGLLADDG